MHKQMRYLAMICAGLLLLAGCGKKEAPQVVGDTSEKPQIVDLSYEVVGNVLELKFSLAGDPAGLGYQIDRTQVDPYCHCLDIWRRYYERPAMKQQVGTPLTRPINLKTDKVEFVFRIRAIDRFGNFGPWSKAIHARAVDLSK